MAERLSGSISGASRNDQRHSRSCVPVYGLRASRVVGDVAILLARGKLSFGDHSRTKGVVVDGDVSAKAVDHWTCTELKHRSFRQDQTIWAHCLTGGGAANPASTKAAIGISVKQTAGSGPYTVRRPFRTDHVAHSRPCRTAFRIRKNGDSGLSKFSIEEKLQCSGSVGVS